MLEIETRYYNDGGDQDNVFCLSPAEQRNRIVGMCLVIIILILLELRPIFPAVTPLALLALCLAFPAVTPQHCYDMTPLRPIARLHARRSRAPAAGLAREVS